MGGTARECAAEYLTAQATGVDFRTDHAKSSTMYLRATVFVGDMVGSGTVSLAELVDIYFNGTATQKEKVNLLGNWQAVRPS